MWWLTLPGTEPVEEAAQPGHALVPHHEQVIGALGRLIDERRDGVGFDDLPVDGHAGAGVPLLLCRHDGLTLCALGRGEDREGGAGVGGDLHGAVDGLGRRLLSIRPHEDALVHGR